MFLQAGQKVQRAGRTLALRGDDDGQFAQQFAHRVGDGASDGVNRINHPVLPIIIAGWIVTLRQ